MKKYIFILIAICLAGCSKKHNTDAGYIKKADLETTNTVSITITGDLLFEQGLYDSLDNYYFDTYFDQVKKYLKGDLIIGNQEVPIGGEALGVSGIAYTFNAPEAIASQLKEIGFNVLTLANNHSYDMGMEGIQNTLINLNATGIETVGMYTTEEDSHDIKVLNVQGVNVAILAYTYDTNIPVPVNNNYSVKTFLNEQHEFDNTHKALLQADIKKAQEQADIIIVAMHWGNEFTYNLSQTQIQAAQYLNELGVDLIIGNHPHCLQTIDVLSNDVNSNVTTVFYSLGNFVSAAANVDRASPDFTNMYEVGAIVNLNIEVDKKTKIVTINQMELTPIINHFEHNYQNFALLPLSEYTEDKAAKHFQREFNTDFNIPWIKSQIDYLFADKIDINY